MVYVHIIGTQCKRDEPPEPSCVVQSDESIEFPNVAETLQNIKRRGWMREAGGIQLKRRVDKALQPQLRYKLVPAGSRVCLTGAGKGKTAK